jgi:polysaccharide pyruvyl transferase WcaK-like protein
VVVAGESLTPSIGAAAAAVVSARMVRRPVVLLGIGCGPIETSGAASMARWVIGRADLMLLSDEGSAAHLAAAGVPTPMRVAADPAWVALRGVDAAGPRGESTLVALDGKAGPTVEKGLASALSVMAGRGHRIRLLPWAGPGTEDAAMASRLRAAVAQSSSRVETGSVTVEPAPATLSEAAAMCADARVVVALRDRAVLAAAAAGVPVVGVGTDPPIAALGRRLGQTVVAPAALASALPEAVQRVRPSSAPSPATVKEEMVRAEAGLRLLRLVLEPEAVGAAELDDLPLVPVPWLS